MEPTKTQLDDLTLLIESGTNDQIRDFLNILHPALIADLLESYEEAERLRVLSVMDLKMAADVLAEVQEPYRRRIVKGIVRDRLVDIIEEMESDDAADLLGDMRPDDVRRILSEMDIEESAEISRLLRYPEDTAGGIMQAEMVAIKDGSTVDQAIEAIRTEGDRIHDLHNVFIVDGAEKFLGLIPLHKLIVADPDTNVSELMDTEIITADVMMDQEEVAGIFRQFDFISLPVLDSQKHLLGRIMVDDIVDVLDEEADEDFLMIAGTFEDNVSSLSLPRSVGARLPWLFVTFIGGALTASIIAWYGGSFHKILFFIPFLPLIVGMAGNVGNQSATIIIRGLATGKVDALKVRQVALKEIGVGLVLGVIYGILLGLVTSYMEIDGLDGEGMMIGLAAGLSLTVVVTMAAILGAMLPILFNRINVDPALATAPFISTSMDLLGATVYLSFAVVLFS